MINNFSYFLYNNNLMDYLNCYSTFLMTRKDLKNNILNHRMNFLINYYIQNKDNKINKYKLIEYYMRSYKDDYIKKSNIIIDDDIKKKDDEIEKRDDDVEDHYKYMFINTSLPAKPEIDYDEIDRIYLLNLEKEEREKEREKEILLENEYDDLYNDNNDDYNEDIDYYSEDDYFEINEEYY